MDDEVDDLGIWFVIFKFWDKGLVYLNFKFKIYMIEWYWDVIFDLFFFYR